MQSDPFLDRFVPALAETRGVAAIVLGGSRARRTASEASDYDLGLYFSRTSPLDTEHLLQVATTLVDKANAVDVTPVGGWGPWIIGGGWLTICRRKVDLLYRNLDAVADVIGECRAGEIGIHYQPGHPHGFCSAIWMGEIALCRPLHDPKGTIAELKALTSPFPEPLREALLRRFQWEILFSIENAEIAIPRGEQSHIAGCVYRALACLAQVLFALNERYLINEKGALQEAETFPLTIPNLMNDVGNIWQLIGEKQFAAGLARLRKIDQELKALTGPSGPARSFRQ